MPGCAHIFPENMIEHLHDDDAAPFIKAVSAQCEIIRGLNSSNKQMQAIDVAILEKLHPELKKRKGPAVTTANGSEATKTETTTTEPINTAPCSPGTQADAVSTVPTPSLTTEESSPQSTSPPSTDSGHIEDTLPGPEKAELGAEDTQTGPIAREVE